jgi:hypothetical protein
MRPYRCQPAVDHEMLQRRDAPVAAQGRGMAASRRPFAIPDWREAPRENAREGDPFRRMAPVTPRTTTLANFVRFLHGMVPSQPSAHRALPPLALRALLVYKE